MFKASPSPDTLRSLSVRSISPSLSLGSAVLSYLLGAALVTQPNVSIPVSISYLLDAALVTQPDVTIPVSMVNTRSR